MKVVEMVVEVNVEATALGKLVATMVKVVEVMVAAAMVAMAVVMVAVAEAEAVEAVEVVDMAVAVKDKAILAVVKAAEATMEELRVEVALATSWFHRHMRSNWLTVTYQTTCMSRMPTAAGGAQKRTRTSRSRLPSRFHSTSSVAIRSHRDVGWGHSWGRKRTRQSTGKPEEKED